MTSRLATTTPVSADLPIGVLDSRLAIGQSVRVVWVIVLSALSLFGYGLLNVVTPRTTFAWQVRSTARDGDGDPRNTFGTSFQRWLGVNPELPPDDAALRRVRIIGIVEIALSLAIISTAFLAMS